MQEPFSSKHPPVSLSPLVPVEVAVKEIDPLTASRVPGVLVAIPTCPMESIRKAVPVENVVEVETAKRGMVVDEERPATERRAKGVVVPIPSVPPRVEVAIDSTTMGTVVVGRRARVP